jgi:hypothetical protein
MDIFSAQENRMPDVIELAVEGKKYPAHGVRA